MNEGKKLLIKVLDSEIDKLMNIDTSSYVLDEINLVELSSSLKTDYKYFSNVTDNIINEIIKKNNNKYKETRDLYVGKKEYDIDILNITKYEKIVEDFITELDKYLESRVPDITKIDEYLSKTKKIKDTVSNNFLIEDTEFIKKITYDYDFKNYHKNMLNIMLYITDNNINLLNNKIGYDNKYVIDVKNLSIRNINPEILSILHKLNIDVKKIPNYLLDEIKNCDVNNFINVYNLIKKNKVENYGILHLLDKSNIVERLSLMLFSTEKAIKEVVNSINFESNDANVDVLKSIINYVLPVFFVKKSNYFEPKHSDYLNNIELLQFNHVNFREVIKKCPLLLITNSYDLRIILNKFEQYGFDKKKVINRCYKVLANNPYQILDNLSVLKKYNVNLQEFADDKNNYLLLKVENLELKLNYFIKKESLDKNNIDINKVTKLIVSKIYNDVKEESIWSD